MENFRSLCVKLVKAWDRSQDDEECLAEIKSIVDRARVALAETEPVRRPAIRTVQPSYTEGQRSRKDVEMAVRIVHHCKPHKLQPGGDVTGGVIELMDRARVELDGPDGKSSVDNEEFWRRDALEKLLDAAMRFRLDVYSAEELELYEKRARFFLDRWDCPGLS